MSLKALIAEDEESLANNIRTYLSYEEFEGHHFSVIHIAGSGTAALQLIKDDYDVVILDLKMPQVDGTQVIEALSLLPAQRRPAVILITAYPGSFETARITVKMGAQAVLNKPFDLAELVEVLREVLKTRHQLLEAAKRGTRPQCQWTLGLNDVGASFIHVRGLLNYADNCLPVSWIRSELLTMGRQQEIVGELLNTSGTLHHHWKFYARTVGIDLFRKLFVASVEKSFITAGSVVLHSHDLRLTFVGPRHFLKIPLEFLNDGFDYLVLRYPMKRFVGGISSKRHISLLDFSSQLWEKREKLRILLIASNTYPPIDAVDTEVAKLYDQLKMLPSERYAIDYIPTEKASYDKVVEHLLGCRYHLLHYAGHGHYDERLPGRSSLYFWAKEGKCGEVKSLSIDALKQTLRQKGHELQFVYLSSCSGMTTGDENVLLDDDFLGIADGLIMAGIPSVLGFRWPVTDSGAKELALAFYKSLVEQGNLSTALFHARCAVAASESGRDNGDWLSPILIAQGWG